MQWNDYRITTRHDAGRAVFIVPAENIGTAIARIMTLERCPRRSIVRVQVVRRRTF